MVPGSLAGGQSSTGNHQLLDPHTLLNGCALQEEHPGQWQAYVAQATEPLKTQLVSLGQKQEQGAAGAAELRESLETVLARVGAAQAAIAALQASAPADLLLCKAALTFS